MLLVCLLAFWLGTFFIMILLRIFSGPWTWDSSPSSIPHTLRLGHFHCIQDFLEVLCQNFFSFKFFFDWYIIFFCCIFYDWNSFLSPVFCWFLNLLFLFSFLGFPPLCFSQFVFSLLFLFHLADFAKLYLLHSCNCITLYVFKGFICFDFIDLSLFVFFCISLRSLFIPSLKASIILIQLYLRSFSSVFVVL